MRITGLLLFALISVSSAQVFGSFGLKPTTTTRPFIKSYPVTTKYYSGGGDDGQYHPDDTGAYNPDGAGAYVHSDDPYKHLNGPNGGGSGYTGGFGPGYKGINNYNGDNSGQYRPDGSGGYIHSDNPYLHQGGSQGGSGPQYSSGGVAPTKAPSTSTLKTGNAAGLYDNKNYAIIRKVEQVEQDGYHYLYETENGIFGEEEGHLENKGSEAEAMHAKGFFSYTGPDNVVYEVQYTATEDGFLPVGSHIPAVPEYITRSLEYQRSIGVLKK